MRNVRWVFFCIVFVMGCSKPTEVIYNVEYVTMCSLEGRILPAGIGAVVSATQNSKKKSDACDAKGYFFIDSLTAGSCILEVKSAGYGSRRSTQTLIAGGFNNTGDITLKKIPSLISVFSPDDQSDWTSVGTSFHLYFTQPMNKTSVEKAFSVTPATAGYFRWNSVSDVYFTPLSKFKTQTTYTFRVDSSARSESNEKLEFPLVTTFTTEPFRIESISPVSGTKDFELGATASISFPYSMSPDYASVENSIIITPATELNFNWYSGNSFTLKPKGGFWKSSTSYTIIVSSSAQDISQNKVFAPCTTVFTTEPVMVTSSTPANNSSGVRPTSGSIVINFNTAMNYDALMNAFSLRDSLDTPVIPTSAYLSGIYAYIYLPALNPLSRYVMTIDSSATDNFGATLPAPYSITFTTGK